MPTLGQSKKELESFFIDGWGITTPILFDDVSLDMSNEDQWVRVIVQPYSNRNITIGNSMNSSGTRRDMGVVVIQVNVKKNIGSGTAWELVDQVKGIMVNKSIVSNLWTDSGDVRRSGAEESGFYQLSVSIKFVSNDIS